MLIIIVVVVMIIIIKAKIKPFKLGDAEGVCVAGDDVDCWLSCDELPSNTFSS